MKKILLGATAAIMTLVSGAASAQSYNGYDGRDSGRYDRAYDRDGRPDVRDWSRDRDGRNDRYDRHDDRRERYEGRQSWHSYSGRGHWRQGQVYPYYRQSDYVIYDYRAYNLPQPRYGYRYYRSDNGDVVMAAIASGVIGVILGNAISDNDRHDHRYYGR